MTISTSHVEEGTFALTTPTGVLAGTLTTPTTHAADHVAFIIAGSGPTDRDGNTAALPGKNDSLKLLAGGLAASGIASLRTDKRGVGASARMAEESDARFEIFVDDAVAWLDRLRAEAQFRHVSVIGHSEGSLIGMVAAQRRPVDAFVSVEGAGRTAQATLMRQLGAQLPPQLVDQVRQVVDELTAGRTVDPLPAQIVALPSLAALFRTSVQPYLISWFRYDPVAILGRLTTPILIVQGTNDLQVDLEDAAGLAGANPRARLLKIEGMNHVLKDAPDDRDRNIATYSQPDLPLAEGLVSAVAQFLTEVDTAKEAEKGT